MTDPIDARCTKMKLRGQHAQNLFTDGLLCFVTLSWQLFIGTTQIHTVQSARGLLALRGKKIDIVPHTGIAVFGKE